MIVKIQGSEIPTAPTSTFNPIRSISDSVSAIGDKIDTLIYWLNPMNWLTEGYQAFVDLLNNPATATFIVAGTIVAIILTMLGAESPKRIAFWTWVTYFGLRMIIPS